MVNLPAFVRPKVLVLEQADLLRRVERTHRHALYRAVAGLCVLSIVGQNPVRCWATKTHIQPPTQATSVGASSTKTTAPQVRHIYRQGQQGHVRGGS